MKIVVARLSSSDDNEEHRNYMAILYGKDGSEVWVDHTTNVVSKREAQMVAQNMKAAYIQGFKDALSSLPTPDQQLREFDKTKIEFTD
jgi:hypothetical protein